MTTRQTKTIKNLENGNNLDDLLAASGVSPITLETVNKKLDDMKRSYHFWLYFFLAVNVIDVLLLIFKSK